MISLLCLNWSSLENRERKERREGGRVEQSNCKRGAACCCREDSKFKAALLSEVWSRVQANQPPCHQALQQPAFPPLVFLPFFSSLSLCIWSSVFLPMSSFLAERKERLGEVCFQYRGPCETVLPLSEFLSALPSSDGLPEPWICSWGSETHSYCWHQGSFWSRSCGEFGKLMPTLGMKQWAGIRIERNLNYYFDCVKIRKLPALRRRLVWKHS